MSARISVRMVQQALIVRGFKLPRSCPDTRACDGLWGEETGGAFYRFLTKEYGSLAEGFTASVEGGTLVLNHIGNPDLADKVVADLSTLGFQYVPGESFARPGGPIVNSQSAVTPSRADGGGGGFAMPTWAWGLIGAGVVVGGFFLYRRMA